MKITKDRIHSWEQVHDKEYDKDLDDELIILLKENETSLEMAEYILECQEKAEKWDKVEKALEVYGRWQIAYDKRKEDKK